MLTVLWRLWLFTEGKVHFVKSSCSCYKALSRATDIFVLQLSCTSQLLATIVRHFAETTAWFVSSESSRSFWRNKRRMRRDLVFSKVLRADAWRRSIANSKCYWLILQTREWSCRYMLFRDVSTTLQSTAFDGSYKTSLLVLHSYMTNIWNHSEISFWQYVNERQWKLEWILFRIIF